MSSKWILDENNEAYPVDLMTWARWFETADRLVRQTQMENGIFVSTVFLGIEHNFLGGPPLIFETMAFKSRESKEDEILTERCTTWDQAVKQHNRIVKSLR